MDKQEIYALLRDRGLWHEVTEHPAVFNMAEMAQVQLPYPQADAKNMLVRDDKKRSYYLLTVRGDKRVDYFIALYENQTPRADLREIRRVMLLPLDAALEALSHPSGRNILLTADSMLRQGDFVPSGLP